MVIQFDEDKQEKHVGLLLRQEEEELAQVLSQKYGLEYADLSAVPVNTDALRLIPEPEARAANAAVFDEIGKKVKVAILSPNKDETVESVRNLEKAGYAPTLYMVSKASLDKAWGRYKDLSFATETKAGSFDISDEEVNEVLSKVESIADITGMIDEVLKAKKTYRTSRILEIIVAGALALKASDIHIEPEETTVQLRYRLDGVLVNILNITPDTYSLLLSRIKLLSGLKLNIKSNAQDGRFSVDVGPDEIEIRTSLLPGAYSESVVMRVLNPKSIGVPLEELGIEPKLLTRLLHEIDKPNGMVLTTGPTGSGKTTTLYAFLKKIQNPGIKIITIEDPIEYHLAGIVQTQTDAEKGYTFLAGLRSSLRQDPDVIMVGEIRDEETAQIAVNSALTGHLVFSTLHTNNAAGAFPRLIDLGVNPKVITSAINIVIAQRLLRKLCPECRKEVVLDDAMRAKLTPVIMSAAKKGFADAQTLAVAPQNMKLFSAVGCVACNNTGYRGRIGIYEAVLVDESIEKIIKDSPSEREIRAAAEGQNLLTLVEDGILKAVKGVTSLDELERVIDLEGNS